MDGIDARRGLDGCVGFDLMILITVDEGEVAKMHCKVLPARSPLQLAFQAARY